MAHDFLVPTESDKGKKYFELLPQLEALCLGEEDSIANLSNLTAGLKTTFNWLWVGFYLVKSGQLVLGPFQGPVACTRIDFGKGVCGTSWKTKQTILVPDVEKFEGHIACSSQSKSEIVVPIIKDGEVRMVLDIDSELLNDFDEIDKMYLEKLATFISNKLL